MKTMVFIEGAVPRLAVQIKDGVPFWVRLIFLPNGGENRWR